MMVEFRWIQMSLFLIAVLQFTAAGEKHFSSFTVRVGDDVTLPCGNVIDGQQQCESTTWLFSVSGNTAAVELITLGQIGENAKSKSDRLSVTENCSLVIKKVTDEDVGHYTCRLFNSTGQQQGPDSQVLLSVITMTEQKNNDEVTLNCSVSTFGRCEHKVKWLFQGQDVDKDNQEIKTSQSVCSASVKFLTSHHIYTSRFNFLKCEVTDGEKPGDDTNATTTSTTQSTTKTTTKTTTTTTQSTTKTTVSTTTTTTELKGDTQTTTTESTRTTEKIQKSVTNTTAGSDSSAEQQGSWWVYMIVAVVSAVLLIIVIIRLRRAKGKNTQTDQNIGLSLKPAVAPETSQDTAEPDGGVSYASISYTRTPKSKAQVLGKDGIDDDEALTYSTVKAPSSAGASADPSSFYSIINKPME